MISILHEPARRLIYRLVGTHSLRGECVVDRPIEPLDHPSQTVGSCSECQMNQGMKIWPSHQVSRTVFQVDILPLSRCLCAVGMPACLGAIQIPGKRVIEAVVFDDDLNRRIIRPEPDQLRTCRPKTPTYHSRPKKPARKYSADLSILSCVCIS